MVELFTFIDKVRAFVAETLKERFFEVSKRTIE
jgi:hypothetical protein